MTMTRSLPEVPWTLPDESSDQAQGRFLGCLLGGAVDDALGAPVEFLSPDAIRQKFGAPGIRDFVPAYGRKGAITDDTARGPKARMALTYKPFTTSLKHVFTIATSSRTTTPGMLTQIAYDGVVGYGEASMPPYLGETQESCAAFLAKVDLGRYSHPFELETILAAIDRIAPGNPAAKAAVELALHDLVGKLLSQPWYNIWGYNPAKTPFTSFTIGIDTPDVVRQKVREAAEYKVLKVKLGRENDREMIETIRSVTDKRAEARRSLGRIQQLTRGALAELRMLLLELRPAALADADLGLLLRQLADGTASRKRLRTVVQSDGPTELPVEVKIGLYRIAQEALANVVKHARATQVDLLLETQGCAVRLRIEDNGCPAPSSGVQAAGLGLQIRRERAENVGASLCITAADSSGTRVEVRWPAQGVTDRDDR